MSDTTLFLLTEALGGLVVLCIGICIGACIGYDRGERDREPKHAVPRLEPVLIRRTLPIEDDAERHLAAMRPEHPTWVSPARVPELTGRVHAPRHAGETDTGWMRRLTDDFIAGLPALARGGSDGV